MGGAVRVGDTVRRTSGAWTPTIHRLLEHLHARGVTWVPRPLGYDDDGREVVDYLPGIVPNYPLPDWIWEDAVLVAAVTRMAEFHDVTGDFHTAGTSWQLPSHEPQEVVCHNDFAPYNMVFVDNSLTGVIDWDTASPGPRVWDLAYLAYRLVPLCDPVGGDGIASPIGEKRRRLELACTTYGSAATLHDVATTAIDRLHDLAAFTETRAREAPHLSGHVRLYQRDSRWIAEHLTELTSRASPVATRANSL